MAILYFILLGIVFLVGIGGTILWIAALVSCLKNESSSDNTKIIWAIVILFTHCLGAILYFLIRRPQRVRELGR